MGLDEIVRNAVATVNTITADLQDGVSFFRWIGQDGFGKMVYAPAITVQALVEQKQRLRTLQGGQTIMTRFKLTILTVLDPQGTSNRTEPIDTRDKFVLVDGSTGPIVDVEGLIDPATGSPYMYEVWLGVAAGGGQR